MKFKPLYYKDRLRIINPNGNTGVITLWSDPDWVLQRFDEAKIDLTSSSPISAVGTLYGNGFRELLRNLVYNPQIQYLVVCGKNRSGSLEDLMSFFEHGVEPISGKNIFFLDGKAVPACKIAGRSRIIDCLVHPEDLGHIKKIFLIENIKDTAAIREKFSQITLPKDAPLLKRRNIPLPEAIIEELPCAPRSFVITKDNIIRAWEELIFILYRFGKVAYLRKGERKELQNVKVVIENPWDINEEKLKLYGFSYENILDYQKEILSADLAADVDYTYGNRLRDYFGKDTLTTVINRLKNDEEDRLSFISLWDTFNDLTVDTKKSTPCLVSLFFRKYDSKLTCTASFRTHNALDAWIFNAFGIQKILQYVAERTGMSPGAITIFSHSISIDNKEMARASLVIEKSRHAEINLDPHGYFKISLDRTNQKIIVHHMTPDHVLIKEYKAKRAVHLQHQLVKDMAISDINHAIYMGRQLAMAEQALSENKRFKQE